MTARQWMKSVVGKGIDYDGAYGFQCVDIIKKYFVDIIGIPAIRNNAIDYWTNYPTAHFTKVVNTPAGIPPVGSIIIWGRGVGTYGHIAIVYSANVNQFESLDQNWPFSNGTTPAKFIMHNYSNVLGWLIPKKDVNTDWAALEAARKAAEQAALIAKQAEDARIAAEAAEAARLAQIEVDRLAAEKAEADRIAAEKAAAAKAEAERIAQEQALLEAEVKAKQEAEYGWKSFLIKVLEIITKFIKGEL